MKKKVFNIISGNKSGALNIAMDLGDYLKSQGYEINTIFRKYNNTELNDVILIKDRCTLDYVIGLAKLINEAKPNIILVHGYSTHLWTKMAVAYAKVDVKLIHIEHNAEKYTPLRSWLVKKLDQYTDQYICVSKGVAANLLKQGITGEKVSVIYNGIDIEKFNIQKEQHEVYTIGMTARFSKQKDQMTLIKAVELLIKQNVKLQLILVGGGKTKKKCEEYVQKNHLQNAICFKTGKFIDIIPQLDLFVLSTHYEGLPLVLCEAMAAHLPVIATNVAGVDEIVVDGQTGFLVEENNYKQLADKIAFVKNNQGTNSINILVNQSLEVIRKKFNRRIMCDYYKNIINKIGEKNV